MYLNYIVLGYNPKMVKEAELPKRWEDLLLPQWKGNKFAMDRDEGVWYGGLSLYWGAERADKFMKALAVQDPSMRKGHTLIATLLSTGEFPLGLVYAHRIEEMKTKGAAVDWMPLDPIIVTHNGRQGFTIPVMGSPKMIRAGRLLWFRELDGPCCRRLRSQCLSV